MTTPKPIILLVEDDEDDVFFMRRALSKTKIDHQMQVASNGEEALHYLEGAGPFGDRAQHPMPDVVFLDLKLPFVNGFEVLERIRQVSALAGLDVVVLTSSPEDRDRNRATALRALAYCVKPPTEQMLLEVFRLVPALANAAPAR